MSAVGRLLTAQLPDTVLAEILATNTPQDAAIKNALNELRSSGQIIDRAAIEADVISMARIVRNHKNEIVGAIEVLSPQYRAKVEHIAPLLEEAATTLSSSLGAGSRTGLMGVMEKEVTKTTDERKVGE
jgi:DNA-binding IclR family transcriptional regulator